MIQRPSDSIDLTVLLRDLLPVGFHALLIVCQFLRPGLVTGAVFLQYRAGLGGPGRALLAV